MDGDKDAQRAMLVDNQEDAEYLGVNVGDEIIILKPRQLILGHTQEIVGTIRNFNTLIQSKSTSGRIGLTICKDSNFGSVGYVNKWTLEIENHSEVNIILKVGQKIAQMIFYHTGTVANNYNKIGQYNSGETVEEITKNWKPEHMLPGIALKYLKEIKCTMCKEESKILDKDVCTYCHKEKREIKGTRRGIIKK